MKKKWLFILLIIIIIVSIIALIIMTFNKNTLNIKDYNTASYKNINIINEDIENIVKKINRINFKNKTMLDFLDNDVDTLDILGDNNSYYFVFVDGEVCYQLVKDNSFEFTCGNDKGVEKELNDIIKKYSATDFYSIEYTTNNNDYKIVNLDNSDESIIIKLNDTINKISIDSIILNDDNTISSNEILFEKENTKDTFNIKVTLSENIPTFRITLTNKYGINFSFIPIYNGKNGNLTYYSLYE